MIAGEASGDLHAANVIKSLKKLDSSAEIRFFGGDLMAKEAGSRAPLRPYECDGIQRSDSQASRDYA